MVLLIKDHKGWSPDMQTPPPSRPVVSGNCGLNCHLSELISHVIEPLTSELEGCEIDSTLEMLNKVDEFNEKMSNGNVESIVDDCGLTKVDRDNVEDLPMNRTTDTTSTTVTTVRNRSDIRSFGCEGSKTKIDSPNKIKSDLRDRIESLRKTKSFNLLPKLDDRMKAGQLMDKLESYETIELPGHNDELKCLGVKQKLDEMCILGSDVVSLFPSLKGMETARLARHAVLNSTIEFGNVDYLMALRYLTIVGGTDLLHKAGIGRLTPVWLGDRQDLTTVGGRKSKDSRSWWDLKKEIRDFEKRRILAYVMECMVNVVMGSHVYSFGGKYFLQREGGPIGLRSTATLASMTMKLWDIAWLSLLKRECIKVFLYFRYVDDAREFLPPLLEGWRWADGRFRFDKS